MNECWGDLNGPRKQPQAIMRDINQVLYQVYNSRRIHAYATAFPKLFNDHERTDDDDTEIADNNSSSDCESRASSLFTDRTSLPWDEADDSKYHIRLFGGFQIGNQCIFNVLKLLKI